MIAMPRSSLRSRSTPWFDGLVGSLRTRRLAALRIAVGLLTRDRRRPRAARTSEDLRRNDHHEVAFQLLGARVLEKQVHDGDLGHDRELARGLDVLRALH